MKKISTKLSVAMFVLTVVVLAFVGATVIINICVDYYKEFDNSVSLVFETDAFASVCERAKGDKDIIFEYITQNEAVLCRDSKKECYILQDSNIVKSTVSGGIVEYTPNLLAVLSGGVSGGNDITKGKPDFAVHTGYGTILYVRDTCEDLYSQIANISVLFLQALVIGVLFTIILGFVISKRLTKSLKLLEEGARNMQKGDFLPVQVKSRDEVGSLCEVFNEMGEQIQSDFDRFEKIEKSRREFVANVSHELKTPITVIKSYAETLRDLQADADTQKQFLTVIDSEADKMSDIVTQLLKISRLEGEGAVSEYVDVNALVSEILEELCFNIKEKRLSVLISGKCTLLTDTQKVKTILLNLITNAIKYSEQDGEINICLTDGKISVIDCGIGIGESDLPHIFERFYRTDKARGRDTGGTGLGLAIAKECADIIGATLTVKSVPFESTEFTLEFENE